MQALGTCTYLAQTVASLYGQEGLWTESGKVSAPRLHLAHQMQILRCEATYVAEIVRRRMSSILREHQKNSQQLTAKPVHSQITSRQSRGSSNQTWMHHVQECGNITLDARLFCSLLFWLKTFCNNSKTAPNSTRKSVDSPVVVTVPCACAQYIVQQRRFYIILNS